LMSEQNTALATVSQAPTEIAVHAAQMFTEAQEQMIRDMFAPTASELEFRVLISIARARRLNPLLSQIHFVKRRQKIKEQDNQGHWIERWEEKWSCQVAIDGLRSKAEETGRYDGQDEAEFDREDGQLVARVRVYRKGISRPFVGVAYWNEFVQTYGRGDRAEPTRMWAQMPRHMLAKCAEALALRKAFPEELAGLYTPEEMGQAENDRGRRQAAPQAPTGPTAHELAERASGATTIDAAIEVLRTARTMPRVRAVAYRKLVELSPTLPQLSVFVANIQSDDGLPEDIRSKLLTLAEERRIAIDVPEAEHQPAA